MGPVGPDDGIRTPGCAKGFSGLPAPVCHLLSGCAERGEQIPYGVTPTCWVMHGTVEIRRRLLDVQGAIMGLISSWHGQGPSRVGRSVGSVGGAFHDLNAVRVVVDCASNAVVPTLKTGSGSLEIDDLFTCGSKLFLDRLA